MSIMGRWHLTKRPLVQYDSNQRATKHDDSGQVFTEVTCKGSPMIADWVWKTKGSSREAGRFRSIGPGCASLVNMAIRKVLKHSYDITPDSLRGLPWSIGKVLWQSVVASQLDSVKVWKAFATTYGDELDASLKRRYHVIDRPNMTLASYITPVTSPSMHWITHLTLSNIICSRTCLIQISKLLNVGVLTIGADVKAPDIGLDDSIVRTWALSAARADAFGMLRVLNCRSQMHMTSMVFGYLNYFPALAIFNVEVSKIGPRDKDLALEAGWEYSTGKKLADWLVREGATGRDWDSITHACYGHASTFRSPKLTEHIVEGVSEPPVLHLALGGEPHNTAVDKAGDESLRSFQRLNRRVVESIKINNTTKRPLKVTTVLANPSRKKPVIRASKQQAMEDLLVGFGTQYG